MHIHNVARVFASVALFIASFQANTVQAQGFDSSQQSVFVPSLVTRHVDESNLVKLSGNVFPMATPERETGRATSSKMLQRMMLVLKRSPEQEKALAAFNERQYDPASPDFHHWLTAEEFGRLYGPSDSDMAAITNWLQSRGFTIDEVSKGRVSLQFSGTISQVESAFHVEMHTYLVDGKEHLANDRDPQIPEALSPVITGVASLNDFFPKHYSHPGNYVKRDLKTGKYTLVAPVPYTTKLSVANDAAQPQSGGGVLHSKTDPTGAQPELGYVDASTGYQREVLSPYDVAAIYNILPLWNQSTPINGKGVKVAIVGLSDVVTSDFNTFRSSFGLPAGSLTTLHSGADPGLTGSQGENTEDVEMVSATAPGAQIVLVADVDNSTTNGLVTAINYIVENKIAPILTMSYGECELNNGSSANSLFNQIFQQAATSGISSFVASGDSGSGVCTRQDGTPPYADTYGLQVSGMASTPYVTAVGGTDLQWPFTESAHPISTYWNSTNDAHGASAKGYMPEMSWNDTCTNPLLLNVYTSYNNSEDLCNAAINSSPGLVEMGAGSGGVSNCTTPSGTTTASCSGGYAKPSWQTGVAGIPADGKRDVPDVSLFAAYGFQNSTGIPGSALLVCQASASTQNSCDYNNPNYIVYQENGGTSASSPLTAGIMALVVQKTGSAQGLANPVLYQLAAKQNYSACNSNTVAAGNSCIFYDTTSGSNAAVCITGDPDCITNTAGDQAGLLNGYNATAGYDLTTGLGSFNVTNLVNAWPVKSATVTATVSPTSVAFASTKVGSTAAYSVVTLKNTGTATLSSIAFSITGTNASSFFLPSSHQGCGATLAAGASCTFDVAFTPTAGGALSGSVRITDNATNSPQTVALSGTGASTTSTASVSPSSVAFSGTTKVGSTSAYTLVTLSNTGSSTITGITFSVTGTNASSFFLPSNHQGCGSTLAAGANCTFDVAFRPTTGGALTGSVHITDSAGNSPQTVALSGTGASTTSTASVSPSSVVFSGTTKVGSTSAYTVVTLTNTGGSTITGIAFSVTGTNASSFFLPSSHQGCGSTLAAGAKCTFDVAFKPTASGTLSASVHITDSAGNSPQTVALSGTGAGAATVSVNPTSIAFATTTVGSTSAYTVVTLTNNGTSAVSGVTFSLTGPNASSFFLPSNHQGCGSTLAAGASCTFDVAFKPTATGSLSGTVLIADSAANSPQLVAVSGTGR